MKELGEEMTGYKLREIVEEVDANKSGTVEFTEFLEVSRKLYKLKNFSGRF